MLHSHLICNLDTKMEIEVTLEYWYVNKTSSFITLQIHFMRNMKIVSHTNPYKRICIGSCSVSDVLKQFAALIQSKYWSYNNKLKYNKSTPCI